MQIIIKFTYRIFMSSNNFFLKIVFTFVKMPKDSSVKYYQNKKENKTIKNVHERCQSLSKEEKEKKCINIVMNDTKTYSK